MERSSSRQSLDSTKIGNQLQTRRRQRSWTKTLVSNITRLTIWYTIITVLFRCPPTPEELSASSPHICRPYFNARQHVAPLVQPYYHAYAAPYVDVLRPYADSFQANVYTPAYTIADASYQKYLAPQVEFAYAYGQKQWDQAIKPEVEKAQKVAYESYSKSLGPYVDQASNAVRPAVVQAQDLALNQYQSVLIPTYERAQPYAQEAYNRGRHLATEVGLPYGRWLGETTWLFFQRRLWPQVRILYGQNVQPQLAKIRERLSSYRDGKRLEAAVEAVTEETSSSPVAISSSTSISSVVSSTSTTSASENTVSQTAANVGSESQQTDATAQETVTEDLKIWKAKFARAAEKGADDLRERVTEITKNQISSQVEGTGEALVISLEETVKSSLEDLKKRFIKIMDEIPDDTDIPDEEEEFIKGLARSVIRLTGQTIKEAAQKLRSWREHYDKEIDSLVNTASESTVDVVDNIRDLGLQEIGMRWASMDGVTYKDWSEYHAMRKTFDEWRSTVLDVAAQHEGIGRSKKAAEELESRAMVIAEDAAKELSRLKEVFVWKVEARDASDDFSTRYTPPGAARAARKLKDTVEDAVSGASEAIAGSSQGLMESLSSKASSIAAPIAESASSVQSDASAMASSLAQSVEDNFASASSSASSKSSSASSKVATARDSASSSASDAAASISAKISSAANAASDSGADLSSSVSSKYESLSPSQKVKSAVDAASSSSSELSSSAASKASSASNAASSASDDVSSSAVSMAPSASDDAASFTSAAASSASSKASSVSDSVLDDVSRVSSSASEGATIVSGSSSSSRKPYPKKESRVTPLNAAERAARAGITTQKDKSANQPTGQPKDSRGSSEIAFSKSLKSANPSEYTRMTKEQKRMASMMKENPAMAQRMKDAAEFKAAAERREKERASAGSAPRDASASVAPSARSVPSVDVVDKARLASGAAMSESSRLASKAASAGDDFTAVTREAAEQMKSAAGERQAVLGDNKDKAKSAAASAISGASAGASSVASGAGPSIKSAASRASDVGGSIVSPVKSGASAAASIAGEEGPL